MNTFHLNMLLARLKESRLTPMEWDQLQAEMAADQSLVDTVASLIEMDGMDRAGVLETPTSEDAAAMLQHLHNITSGNEFGDGGGDLDAFEAESVRNGDVLASMWGGKETPDMNSVVNQRQQAIESVFGSSSVEEAPENVGRPGANEQICLNVQQEYFDNCAIKCQQIILEEFGIEVSAEEIAQMAFSNGWYVPGSGTRMDDVGLILQSFGIEVTHYDNANIFNLVSELAQGRQIIIAVDSGGLWSANEVISEMMHAHPSLYADGIADHAVLVSGVDISDPENPVVIITDPGTGQVAAEYSLVDFVDAWETSGFRMISTNISPQQFQTAHVESIGEMSYETFSEWYPHISELSGAEDYFQRIMDTFRQLLHNPLADAMTDVFQLIPGFQSDTLNDNILPKMGFGLLASAAEDVEIGDDEDSEWSLL